MTTRRRLDTGIVALLVVIVVVVVSSSLSRRRCGGAANAAYVAPASFSRRQIRISNLKNFANNENDVAVVPCNEDSLKRRRHVNDYNSSGNGRRNFFQQSAAIFTIARAPGPGNKVVAHASLLSSSSSSIPPLDSLAPSFELRNSRDGKLITLTSLLGTKKWTILYFYPGAFTSGCTLEARNFQTDLPYYQQLNTQIVGVSVDSVEKNSEFCIAEKLDYMLLTDEGGLVSKLYGSSLSIPGFGTFSNRQTYIIDPRGYVRWVFTDVDSKIPRHSGDVLDKLRELQKQQVLG